MPGGEKVSERKEDAGRAMQMPGKKDKMSTLLLELPIDLKDSSLDRFAQSNAHHLTPEGEVSAHPGLH
jgi:hypothetical protein